MTTCRPIEREGFELAISLTRNFAALSTSVLRVTSTEVRRKPATKNDSGADCPPENVQMPAPSRGASGLQRIQFSEGLAERDEFELHVGVVVRPASPHLALQIQACRHKP